VRAAGPGVHTVILDLDANDDLDITSSEVLEKLAAALGRQHVRLALAYVHAPVQDMLSHFEPAGEGGWRVFPTLESAVSWARGSIPTDDAPEAQVGG
jgi:MFS superfamily sulfate permease-like transporter